MRRNTNRSSLVACAEAMPAIAPEALRSFVRRCAAAATAVENSHASGTPSSPRTSARRMRSGAPISLYDMRPSSHIQVSFTASLRRGT